MIVVDINRLRTLRESSRKYVAFEDEVTLNELAPGIDPVYLARGFDQPVPDLSDVLAARDPDHPHILAIWEPLRTKAPSPARCQPWCCYIAHVIFYHRPYMTVKSMPSRWRDGTLHPGSNVFAEYDAIDTRLRGDDIVAFDRDHWKLGGGRVVWKHKRWWMRRGARRVGNINQVAK